MQELNTTVKNVEDIMDIYLKMGQSQLEKDIVTMEFAWFLNLKAEYFII
jgi:hypothetical protein